ncbi:hypothetical protein ABZ769_15345 [Streptomyces olivoreticuli]
MPLAAAWRAGADKWTADQRRDFGNDLKDPQLLIASEPSNSAKGDSGPDKWKPQNRAFWCTYAEDYTHVRARWELTTTASAGAVRSGPTCRAPTERRLPSRPKRPVLPGSWNGAGARACRS